MPMLLWIVVVFVTLSAPVGTAVGSALLVGALFDLANSYIVTPHEIIVLGPYALGYAFGSYLLVQLRGMVFKDSPITIAAMTVIGGLFVHLLVIALLSLRRLSFLADDPVGLAGSHDDLVQRFLAILYSGLLALPIGWLLIKSSRLWGFPTHGQALRGR